MCGWVWPQAGEKNFHPGCASCCKCSQGFGEGEDMCIGGDSIWHLDCDNRPGSFRGGRDRNGAWPVGVVRD